MTDAMHYLSLSLTNVRAFGGVQRLDLSKNGSPSRWCVIIGENGVGKTTLLQTLAMLRPVPALGEDQQDTIDGSEAGAPKWIAPAIADYENDRIVSLVRDGKKVTAKLEAELMLANGKKFQIGYSASTLNGKLLATEEHRSKRTLSGSGAFIIAYSAVRQLGKGNLGSFDDLDPTEALFDEHIELVDPNEVAGQLDYNLLTALRDKSDDDVVFWEGLQKTISIAIADLIPHLEPDGILLQRENSASAPGIRIRTPSGIVPLSKVSLGAQTTLAWVFDLVWKLHRKFPGSKNPFNESAIVLIDEIDLHLHPLWQRSLRKQLLKHFPNIQFIVTTHAPIIAQESIAAEDPISILRWEGDHSIIQPGPAQPESVRLNDIAIEFFELETSLPERLEGLLHERRELLRKPDRTPEENDRLQRLKRIVQSVQNGDVLTESDIERLMAATPEGTAGSLQS